MAMAAFSFMLTACGNNQAKQEQQGQKEQQEQSDDKNKQEVVEEQIQKEDSHSPALDEIRSVWKKKPLSGAAVDGKTDIVRFASVFCNAFPTFDANGDLVKYLKDPDGYDSDDYYRVDIQKQNGYIRWSGCAVVGCDLTTCYWNCDNGHKLVAFDMEVVEKIEKDMAQYSIYGVGLPNEGKDISLSGSVNGEYQDYIYRWNGNGFDLEKTK